MRRPSCKHNDKNVFHCKKLKSDFSKFQNKVSHIWKAMVSFWLCLRWVTNNWLFFFKFELRLSWLGQAFLQDLIKVSSAVVLIGLVKNCNERLPQFEISHAVDYQYNIGQSREIQNRRGEEGDGRRGGKSPTLVSSPWWFSPPKAYSCSRAIIKVSAGGGSIKSKWIKSLMPKLLRRSTTFPKFVLWIWKRKPNNAICVWLIGHEIRDKIIFIRTGLDQHKAG